MSDTDEHATPSEHPWNVATTLLFGPLHRSFHRSFSARRTPGFEPVADPKNRAQASKNFPTSPQSQASHFLDAIGRPIPDRALRRKAQPLPTRWDGTTRFGSSGATAHDDDLQPKAAHQTSGHQVSPLLGKAGPPSANGYPICKRSPTNCASSNRWLPMRSITPRR